MMRLMVEDSGIGVQRSEGQVACFSNAQRGLDGFQVAHFTDQHYVRVLAKCTARSELANEWVSECTSRWFTRHFLCG